MCLRKVLFCPVCRSFGQMLSTAVPTPEGMVTKVMTEEPCGFSYCDWFNPLMSFVDAPVFTGMVERPCSNTCNLRTCQIERVIEICCDGSNRWASFRLQTCKQIFTRQLQESKRKVRINSPKGPSTPAKTPPASLQEEGQVFKQMTVDEVTSFVYSHCTFKDCTKIGKGKIVSFKTEDFYISISSYGNKSTYYINVTDRWKADKPGASKQYRCSFSLLLYKVFWREEDEKRHVSFV